MEWTWREPDSVGVAAIARRLFEWDGSWAVARFLKSFGSGYIIWKMTSTNMEADTTNTATVVAQTSTAGKTSTTSTTAKTNVIGKTVAKGKGKGTAAGTKTMTDFFKPTKSTIDPSKHKTPIDVAPPAESAPAESSARRELILDIHGTRNHHSTDGIQELRISYIPTNIIPPSTLPFDLTRSSTDHSPPKSPINPPATTSPAKSPAKRPHSPTDDDLDNDPTDETEDGDLAETSDRVTSEDVGRRVYKWNPEEVDRIWIPWIYVTHGFPTKVREWERAVEEKKSPKKKNAEKNVERGVGKKGGMQGGEMLRFMSKMAEPTRKENDGYSMTKEVTFDLGTEDLKASSTKVDTNGSPRKVGKSPTKTRKVLSPTDDDGLSDDIKPSTTKVDTKGSPRKVFKSPAKKTRKAVITTDDDGWSLDQGVDNSIESQRKQNKSPRKQPRTIPRISPQTTPTKSTTKTATKPSTRTPSKQSTTFTLPPPPDLSTSKLPMRLSRFTTPPYDSDSDSLPSPSSLLEYLKTPRKQGPITPSKKKDVGVFLESPGGTLYEVESD